jgi:hypothetical protein
MRKLTNTLTQLSENNFDVLNNTSMNMLKGGHRKGSKSKKSKKSKKHGCGCTPSLLPPGVELYCGPVAYTSSSLG